LARGAGVAAAAVAAVVLVVVVDVLRILAVLVVLLVDTPLGLLLQILGLGDYLITGMRNMVRVFSLEGLRLGRRNLIGSSGGKCPKKDLPILVELLLRHANGTELVLQQANFTLLAVQRSAKVTCKWGNLIY